MRWLLFIVLLVPQLVFAQAEIPQGFSFTPPPSDYSVLFLSDIFGVVDGVLHGTGSQIVGTIFGIFNAALLSLGGVLIMYIVIVGTLKTAHEGKALGQKWDSLWFPIRAIVGIAALVPKASGYSMVQIFVMWLVVQGVGVADSVWAGVLNYMSRGGSLVQPYFPQVILPGNLGLIFTAGNILKAETCMYVLRNSWLNDPNKPQVPDFTSTLVVTGFPSGQSPPCYANQGCAPGDDRGFIYFPGHVQIAGNDDFIGQCGSVNWPLSGDQNQVSNPSGAGAYDSRSTAVQQLVSDLQPIAYGLAQLIMPVGSAGGGLPPTLTTDQVVGNYHGMLISAAEDYMSIMAPYYNKAGQQTAQQYQSVLTQAAESGWMMAGDFYFILAAINNTQSGGSDTFAGDHPTGPRVNYIDDYESDAFSQSQAKLALENNVGPFVLSSCPGSTALNGYICNEHGTAWSIWSNIGGGSAPVIPGPAAPSGQQPPWWAHMQPSQYPFFGTKPLQFNVSVPTLSLPQHYGVEGIEHDLEDAVNYLPNQINSMIAGINTTLASFQEVSVNTGTGPILLITQLGNQIINAVETTWLDGMAALGGAAALATLVSYGLPAIGTIILAPVLWLIPLATGILFTLFGTGAALAYYVPLIPFIIFLFTVIGWFAAVIESMIAAPFVALGLMSPEGQHEIFGPAYQAFMLILNLFVRPTLIVIGFIFASILANVMLWALNQSLGIALDYGNVPISTSMSHILSVTALIFIYMMLVLQVMNRCFALIHEVPSRTLRWIGGGVEQFGEESGSSQAMQAAKGAAEAPAGAAGKVGEGMTAGVARAGGGAQEGMAKYKKDKDKKAAQAAESGKPPGQGSMK